MNIFNPVIANGSQTFSIPGGVAGSTKIYLKFASAPSAGTVTFEIQRPGSTDWTSVQNGSLIGLSSGSAQVMADGGFSVVRLTFAGLVGGSGLTLAVVENATGTPASDLLTDGGFGANRRFRVDSGQTGFFAGSMFRTFHEFNIPAAGSLNLLFQMPINFILWSQQIEIDSGGIKVENIVNPTTGGAFTELPVIGRNRMTEAPQPLYISRMQCGQGGTLTGGTVVDVLRLLTNPNQGNSHSSNIVNGQDDERGIPAGSYGIRLTALSGITEATLGTIHVMWEERP